MHVKLSVNGKTTSANGSSTADWRSLRQNSGSEPFQMSNLSKSDNDFMSGHSMNTKPAHLPADLENILPREDDIPPGNVPVNKDHQRLDAYMQPIAASERAAFQSRIAKAKLCNNYHLKGHCTSGESCVYDHRPISASEMKCLQQVNRQAPCPRKGSCRVLNCLGGHICQKPDCRFRGGSNFCKISAFVHQHDLNLAGHEPAIMPAKDSNDFNDDAETVESGSGRGTTTPLRKASIDRFRNGDESDGEMDGEGALLDLDDSPPRLEFQRCVGLPELPARRQWLLRERLSRFDDVEAEGDTIRTRQERTSTRQRGFRCSAKVQLTYERLRGRWIVACG